MDKGRFTLDELIRIICECAGEDESVDLSGDISNVDFADLGWDSLALLETSGRLEREFGIELDEDQLASARTPHDLLALINTAPEMV